MNKPQLTSQGWRYPTDEKRHHREKRWDYKGRGMYHFTLVVAERVPLFGKLVESGKPEGLCVEDFGFAGNAGSYTPITSSNRSTTAKNRRGYTWIQECMHCPI